jgi:hypothetical protein
MIESFDIWWGHYLDSLGSTEDSSWGRCLTSSLTAYRKSASTLQTALLREHAMMAKTLSQLRAQRRDHLDLKGWPSATGLGSSAPSAARGTTTARQAHVA